MKKVESLKDVIELNSNFKTAINLYLNLNNTDKVLSYIPTKSSVSFLGNYAEAVLNSKEQATLLIGPYGKGKSHLLLVLLAVLSLDRTVQNDKIIKKIIKKIQSTDEIGSQVSIELEELWKRNKYLPVLISYSGGDLNQSFLVALNEALNRDNLSGIAPETYYSVALDRLDDWKKNYKNTFAEFKKEIEKEGTTVTNLIADLKSFSRKALDSFTKVYPKVTAGSEFNPLSVSDVLPLYKSVSEKLVEEYKYSGLYIVFDEFSKFIEGQNELSVGNNMKLLQDICELASESQDSRLFFTMVAHKSIKEYGKYLSPDIINSFTGIEGRIIEKYFITSSKNNYELIKNAIVKKEDELTTIPNYEKMVGKEALKEYYQLPAFKSNFQANDFERIILKGCFPINPVASYILLNVSEKVAQNERTLFTFISNDEPHSMARYIAEHEKNMDWSIGADLIYDYFEPLFKKEVVNEYVHNIWLSTEYALNKCETEDQRRIIKALALVLVVNKEDEIPANEKYLLLCVNTSDGNQAINDLISEQVVYKKNSTGTFAFKTRAGSELKSEIKKQREIKGDNIDYSGTLLRASGKYYVIPRKYNTIHFMTRFFVNQFMSVNDFLNIPSAEILLSDCQGDGKVITLYSFDQTKQDAVKKKFEELKDSRIVVVSPKKSLGIKKQLKDYEIIQELRDNQTFTNDNEILKNELPLLIDDLTNELENELFAIYEEDKNTKVLFFDGEKVIKSGVGSEEFAVNECSGIVYEKTAIINNELVNRSVISTGQTKKARLNVIQAILNHECDENFYSGSNQEATVYRSLFVYTHLLEKKATNELNEIIERINMYINSCSDKKVPLKKLIDELIQPPYGFRMGLIPMFLAYVLSERKEDIVIYFADKEVQLTADIVVNMCEHSSDYALYVSKKDLEKEKYISELNVLFSVEDNRNLSANRIKDIYICMQRWFRALAQSSRNMVDLEKYVKDEKIANAMKSIKRAMQKVEYNPFEILFVTFPSEFGTKSLKKTFAIIDECKTYFDDYFDWLQNETSKIIYEAWGGKRKLNLYHTLTEWYEKQSKRSKLGLYNGKMSSFMSCVENLGVNNDPEIALKVAKAVTDVYMENWNEGALDDFREELEIVKRDIESVRDEASEGEFTLSFIGRNGSKITRLYSHADEGTGSVLRNIIEDTMDEYDDLSVNDRVSILLEMIEKIIK